MKFLIISAMFFFLACNNISSSEKKIHFTDIFGNKLESFESFYEKLFNLFGEYVPDTITVEFKEPGTSQFDTTTSTVLIAVSSLRKEETVAHESCHLALASFTTQISNTEQFRFFDEGFCNIFGKKAAGQDETIYRKKALIMAAARFKKGEVSFAQVQKWNDYFNKKMDWTSYDVGASFVYFFQEKYGNPLLLSLWKEIGNTRELALALQTVTGKRIQDIEKEWFDFLLKVPVDKEYATQPQVVKLIPENNATGVNPAIGEITAIFDMDMNTSSICLLTGKCEAGICYTNAYWKDARTLTVKISQTLKSNELYELMLGHPSGKCVITSAYGDDLIPVNWYFKTGKAENLN